MPKEEARGRERLSEWYEWRAIAAAVCLSQRNSFISLASPARLSLALPSRTIGLAWLADTGPAGKKIEIKRKGSDARTELRIYGVSLAAIHVVNGGLLLEWRLLIVR